MHDTSVLMKKKNFLGMLFMSSDSPTDFLLSLRKSRRYSSDLRKKMQAAEEAAEDSIRAQALFFAATSATLDEDHTVKTLWQAMRARKLPSKLTQCNVGLAVRAEVEAS